MYIVYDVTTYGDGTYFAGIYQTKKEAQQRLKWILKNLDPTEDDSWRIAYVPKNIPVNYNDYI